MWWQSNVSTVRKGVGGYVGAAVKNRLSLKS